MLHDPRAFARVCAKMRAPEPARDDAAAPGIRELIERIEAALAARRPPRG
ncbi:hypothetical protein [Sphingomonas lenta]|nr:hypothetical protein [Sphingomonas lenta]